LTYPSPASLFSYLATSANSLAAQHSSFIASLPISHDSTFDESIRFLLAPAVLLTKGVGHNISTMGYVEMCARDSFHTTWLHSYMWPSLERIMLQELAAMQCNSSIKACNGTDGKIPTCILPFIYRPDNIDVTSYFVLRIGRYFESTGDIDTLSELYPSLKRALAYLVSRDVEGLGLPAALPDTFWADWLDVDYMQGRKYAPHIAFTYLAALRVGIATAIVLGDADSVTAFTALLNLGLNFTERVLWDAEAGLYKDIWWDGKRLASYPTYVLSDQTSGVFFGVPLPVGRASSMIEALAEWGSVKKYGLVDIYPFLPGVDDPEAVYGNGGIYPWLTCMHVSSMLASGDMKTRGDGLALFSSMANQMLFNVSQPAMSVAWEYMHGLTGRDMGAYPHGETASCFSVALGVSKWRRRLGGWDVRRGSRPPPRFEFKLFDVLARKDVLGGESVFYRPLHGLSTNFSQPSQSNTNATYFLEVTVGVGGGRVSGRVVAGAGDYTWTPNRGKREHTWAYHPTLNCESLGMDFGEAVLQCSERGSHSPLFTTSVDLKLQENP